jgi:hypothetical protein
MTVRTGRRNFASGAPWEEMAGYSRAVRVGPTGPEGSP